MTNEIITSTSGLLGGVVQTLDATVTAVSTFIPTLRVSINSRNGTSINGDKGIKGQKVDVYDENNVLLGSAIVNSNGSFSMALNPPKINLEVLKVIVTDLNGDVSAPISVIAPDLELPILPIVTTTENDGYVVVGKTEKNSQVTIKDSDGNEIGNGYSDEAGNFRVDVDPAQNNGETIFLTAKDSNGVYSLESKQQVPDNVVPEKPDATSNPDGTQVYGQAEPGTTVVVKILDGTVIGSGTVDATGHFTVDVEPTLANGQQANVTVKDTVHESAPDLVIGHKDTLAPESLTAELNAKGTIVQGDTEANAIIEIKNADDLVVGQGVADAQGHYQITLTKPITDGEIGSVKASDAAGNFITTDVIGPNVAPDHLDAALNDEGTVLTGNTEPQAKVEIRDATGKVIGTGVADAQGNFTINLDHPVVNNEEAKVTATDAAGNDLTKPVYGPDVKAPDHLDAALNKDGTVLTGNTEPQAKVEIRDATGKVIGTGVADAQGNFTINLDHPVVNNEEAKVTATDAAGNDLTKPVYGPDVKAPDHLDAALNKDGTVLTGNTEPQAKVEIRDATGKVIGTGVADAQGNFTINLDHPVVNNEEAKVTATDAAGNDLTKPVYGPDVKAPDHLDAALNKDGTVLTGNTEPQAKVEIRDATGKVIGTGVADVQGNFTINLDHAVTDKAEAKVTAADVIGNSITKSVFGPDIAPDVPTGKVSDDGVTLNGVAEPNSTIEIKGADGQVIGKAITNAQGQFTATLNPVQKNGEEVKFTATDAAGNTSLPGKATAPDITAPKDLSAELNIEGTQVTGKTEAGAKVIVKDTSGNVIGTTIATADGSYAVALSKALTDGAVGKVTAEDASTNTIGPVDVVGTKDTIAPEITDAHFNDLGTEVSGTVTESKSVVTVVDANNKVIGSGTTDADGKFKITLDKAYVQGEKITLVATDPAGNTGNSKIIYADSKIQAHDDVIKADVDLAYKVALKSTTTETKVFGSLGKFLGISILGCNSADISFNVKANETMSVDIKATNFGFATLLDGIRVTLYKQNASGSWDKVVSNTDVGLFNKFFLFFPEQAKIQTTQLPEGNYKIIAEDLSVFSFLSKNILSVTYNTYSPTTELEAIKANTATGNIIADDLKTATTLLTKLTTADGKSVDVPATGTATLVGKYGTMIISADGTYKYTPNKDIKVVGQVDTFTYTITDKSGATSTAKVNVQIGADEVKLNWDTLDPSKPATTLDLHNDQDFVKGTVSQSTVTSDVASGNVYSKYCATSTVNSNTFTVAQGDQTKINVNFKAADCVFYADPSRTTFTWQLQKYNTAKGTWENVSGATGSKTYGIVYSVKNGTTVFDGTVTVADAGQYRVNFKTSGGWSYCAETFDTNVTTTTVNHSKWGLENYGTAEGNIFTGVGVETVLKDSTGINAKLSISTDGGVTFKDVSTTGTSIQGQYGALNIKSDGSYTYSQNKGYVGTDDFVYKVVTANGETQTAHLDINYEYTVKGSTGNDNFDADQILHILQLGTGADTVKFTALNLIEKGDVWTDFSVSQGDKIDVSSLLSNTGANATNISSFLSVVKDGTNTVVKIDLDGSAGSAHVAQDLVVLQNTDVTLDQLLKNNQIVY